MVIIPAIMLLTVPSVVQANDPGGCFMVTSSGKSVNLGQLCQGNETKQTIFRIAIRRHLGRTPVINVKFNHDQFFEMIFDTGASGILITQEMATALNPKPSGVVKTKIADGSIVKLKIGTIDSISVGGAVMDNPTVMIAPKADIGLLGHEFFDKYNIQLNPTYIELRQR
jgi:aspartyl protease family protein